MLFKIDKLLVGDKNKPRGYVILDFRQKYIKLPNGDIVKPEDILSFDTHEGILVYRAPSGELKTLVLDVEGDTPEAAALRTLMDKAAKRSREAAIHI